MASTLVSAQDLMEMLDEETNAEDFNEITDVKDFNDTSEDKLDNENFNDDLDLSSPKEENSSVESAISLDESQNTNNPL